MEIYDTNESFDFDKMVLSRPTLISGGNYFIRCLVNNNPLYIQPPKCKTKLGFTKVGKRFSCDLMFTNENENFIQWMENLENHCQQFIYKNREKWFDGNMELHDIENYFTSPLKLFKSGKYYLVRVNTSVNSITNRPSLKIYDEHENEIDLEAITENTNVFTIIEIQGIKCSSRSFQIELELKQMMVLEQSNIFEKCLIKSKNSTSNYSLESESVLEFDTVVEQQQHTEDESEIIPTEIQEELIVEQEQQSIPIDLDTNTINENDEQPTNDNSTEILSEVIEQPMIKNEDGIEEIDFHLDDLKNDEPFQIKKRNDVYYEMYREARRKAKIARDLALSSYLEAKRIKNTYMLDDIDDSDDSDLENENDFDEEKSLEE
jgi:hypothetical protein